MADEQAAAAEQPPQQQFSIQRIYTKDVSFESPAAPDVFRKPWQPAINVDLNTRSTKIDEEGNYEVVLTIEADAKSDGATLFLVEVQQAGLFQIKGFSEKDMGLVLNVACPSVLLPFARAAVTDVVSKGGFPQLLISPVNFEMLYANKTREEQQSVQGDGGAPAQVQRPGNGETIN